MDCFNRVILRKSTLTLGGGIAHMNVRKLEGMGVKRKQLHANFGQRNCECPLYYHKVEYILNVLLEVFLNSSILVLRLKIIPATVFHT